MSVEADLQEKINDKMNWFENRLAILMMDSKNDPGNQEYISKTEDLFSEFSDILTGIAYKAYLDGKKIS